MTPPGTRVRVGEALVEEGVISEEQLEEALALQRAKGLRLGELLVSEGRAGTVSSHQFTRSK